jgi:6-pyruvoyltetrahydropterin/6-carboxytetrahydropterin synthase
VTPPNIRQWKQRACSRRSAKTARLFPFQGRVPAIFAAAALLKENSGKLNLPETSRFTVTFQPGKRMNATPSTPRTAQIACDFWFEASHQLARADWPEEKNHEIFGKCVRMHGHSYRLQVTLRGPIDPETGMVINFRELKRRIRERVVDVLDHRHLNDILEEIPTAENIACWIADRILPDAQGAEVSRIELWETRNSCAFLDAEDLSLARKRVLGTP